MCWIQSLKALKVMLFVLEPTSVVFDNCPMGQSDHARKTPRLRQDSKAADEDRHDELQTQSPSLSLIPLLDFSTLTSAEEISERFEAVAQELLRNTILSVVHNGTSTDLDILELEFYLQKSGCHEDPFTHGSTEQERSGQW